MRDLTGGLSNGSLRFPLLTAKESDAAGSLDVRAPYDGSLLATVATSGAAHVESALSVANQMFRDRDSWLSVADRVAILERTAELMAARADELALLAASEGGKPLTDSVVEVTRAIDGVRLCVETLRGEAGTVIPLGTTAASADRHAFTRKEPIGIVVAVSAFNHPLNLIVHQVGPAVAAGCPVVDKPAADTPLSCLNFIEILHEAGLPRAWAQAVVTEDRDTAEAPGH